MGASELEDRAREALGLAAAHARDLSRAATLADDAVRLSEELDDPVLLAQALDARLATHAGPEDLGVRLGTSLRLLALVRHVPDPGVRLQAHLWRLTTALEQLDLSTVRRELAALDLLADETGENSDRFHACSRRAMFALTEGDAVGAARLAAEAADAGTAGVADGDAVLRGLHAELARQRGDRTALVHQARLFQERADDEDRAPLLAQAAVLWLEGGEPERAGRVVEQLAPELDHLPRDADWLLVLSKTCEAAAGSGRSGTTSRCASLLTPYAGRGVLGSRAATFAGVVEDYLALATGDHDQIARARAAYRRLGADWWARRGQLARRHEPPAGIHGPRVLHLHPIESDGPVRMWCVGHEGALRRVSSMHGLEYLRLLLARPGVDVPALELTTGAGAESVVRRAIRTALARLELHDGEVAQELRTTIRTGPTCRYEPDRFRPVEWHLDHEHARSAPVRES